MNFNEWTTQNQPSPDMFWKGAFDQQQGRMSALIKAVEDAGLLVRIPDVPSTHTSKSIRLPVLRLPLRTGDVYLRDNFHDVNACFVCNKPPTLALQTVYGDPQDWAWYLAQIERARNYSWREWTDEELADPRILRVKDKRPGVDRWEETRGDKKDRWIKRLSDPAWYGHDWSSGEIIVEGKMGPDCKMYVACAAFMEGMSGVVPSGSSDPYKPGMDKFTVVTDWARVTALVMAVAGRSDRLNRNGTLESAETGPQGQ